VGGFKARLRPGYKTTFDEPVGSYLGAGDHVVWTSDFSGPEVLVKALRRIPRAAHPGCPPRGPFRTVDPPKARALGPGARRAAMRAAIRYAEHGAGRAAQSALHAHAEVRYEAPALQNISSSIEVKRICGAKIVDRTIVVDLRFPRLAKTGIGSLSSAVVFVSRFPRGYKVWWQEH